MKQIVAYQTDSGSIFADAEQAIKYEKEQALANLFSSNFGYNQVYTSDAARFIVKECEAVMKILEQGIIS